MADDRRAMYDGFDVNGAHSAEWVKIAEAFTKQAFGNGKARYVMCPCKTCNNRQLKSKDDIRVHLAKFRFMPDYMLWHEHGEVEHAVDESDRNRGDGDRLDEMLDDIGWEYRVNSEEHSLPEEVQKFYWLLAAADDKVHDGTEVTVLQAVTRLMAMKSKFNFSNNCYNAIVKLIIDLLRRTIRCPKTCTSQKRLWPASA